MTKYTPNPIDLSEISLPADLNDLMEKIAEQVHESWASKRIIEGWKYGKERNDKLKTHPCLVPYSELPEHEKDYDRATAKHTLRLISKLGFNISKKQ